MQHIHHQTKSKQTKLSEETVRLYNQIASLHIQQRKYILNRLLKDLLHTLPKEHHLDITKIRGLGKEIWQGRDAQEYVNEERDSWA